MARMNKKLWIVDYQIKKLNTTIRINQYQYSFFFEITFACYLQLNGIFRLSSLQNIETSYEALTLSHYYQICYRSFSFGRSYFNLTRWLFYQYTRVYIHWQLPNTLILLLKTTALVYQEEIQHLPSRLVSEEQLHKLFLSTNISLDKRAHHNWQ